MNKTLGTRLALWVFIVSQDPPPPQSPVMVQYPHAAINLSNLSHRERLLGSVAVAVDSPRGGVVGQDAKVPVIGGVRVDSVDTVEGDFLHGEERKDHEHKPDHKSGPPILHADPGCTVDPSKRSHLT